jgi:hypothetical protein
MQRARFVRSVIPSVLRFRHTVAFGPSTTSWRCIGDYSELEARQAFSRMLQTHGWTHWKY